MPRNELASLMSDFRIFNLFNVSKKNTMNRKMSNESHEKGKYSKNVNVRCNKLLLNFYRSENRILKNRWSQKKNYTFYQSI
jgi:hypothetical protein